MKNVWLSLASILVALILAEIVLAFLYPTEYKKPLSRSSRNYWDQTIYQLSPIDGIGYELKPNVSNEWDSVTYSTNMHGLRHGPENKSKGDGIFRIAAVGDSYTFGYGIDEEFTFPHILEYDLNEIQDSVNVEVINFGVTGYSSVEEGLTVEVKLPEWDVDLIVFTYVLNDAQTDWNTFQEFWWERHWYHHFNIGRLVSERVDYYSRVQSPKPPYYPKIYDKNAQNWWEVMEAFEKVEKFSTENKIPVVFAVFPNVDWYDNWPKEDVYAPYVNQAKELALEHNFNVVQIGKEFLKHPPKTLRLSDVDAHGTFKAYKLYSDLIKEKILEMNGWDTSKVD